MSRIHLPSTSFVALVACQYHVVTKQKGARLVHERGFGLYAEAKALSDKVNALKHIDPSLWKRG